MSESPASVRATVDHDRCVGHGGCRRIAGGTFKRNAVGQSEALPNGSDSPGAVMEAAESCPVSAITVVSERTGEQLFP